MFLTRVANGAYTGLDLIGAANLKICALILAILLAGCVHPSAIIVSFDIDLQVSSVGPNGVVWTSSPEAISKTVRKPVELDPFGEAVYRSPLFTVSIGTAGRSLGISLTNSTDSEICFGFNEARLSSNFQTASVPMRSWSHLRGEEYLRMTKEDRERRQSAGPQPMARICIGPKQERTVYVFPEPKDVFPSGLMFNAVHPQDTPKLNSDGIGNWVKLHLPMETAGRRENLELKMTARKSFARASYY